MIPTSKTAIFLGMTLAGLVAGGNRGFADDLKPTDGKWQAVEAELAGRKMPDEATKGLQLTIDGEKYVVATNEGEDRGTVRILADEKPSAMDITGTDGPNKGKTFLAIYKVEGDKLVVCYDLTGKARPKEFKTMPKSMLFLATYRKVKS
jgi:uncharacterized protein (TIGR03067 family)